MKVLGRLKYLLGAFALMLTTFFAGAAPVQAEEIPKQRLQLSPAKFDLDELKPGETKEVTLKVQNTGSEKFSYEISVTPYSVVGEEYQQDFNAETNYTDIVDWISLSEAEGEVEPDKQNLVTITVKVPQDVPAGGQYAAVMVRMKEDIKATGEGAAITAYKQAGSIIFASVDGETRKTGSIVETKIPSFLFTPPITATSIVENTGNVHARATYIMQVYPFFGGEEVYTNEEQPTTVTILPETRRLNTLTWDGAPQLGIFKVKQTVKFLDKTEVTEKVVFLCPIWFLLIILAIVFLLIFLIVSRIFKKGE